MDRSVKLVFDQREPYYDAGREIQKVSWYLTVTRPCSKCSKSIFKLNSMLSYRS